MKTHEAGENIPEGSAFELWFEVTRPLVESFAALVGDFSSLHLSEKFGRRSIYRENVVHGMLPLAFIGALSVSSAHEYTCSLRKLSAKFLRPVFVNDRLVLTAKLADAHKENDEISLEYVLKNAVSAAVLTTGYFTLNRTETPSARIDMPCAARPASRVRGVVDHLRESDLTFEDIFKGQEDSFEFEITPEHEYSLYHLLSTGLFHGPKSDFQDWVVRCNSVNILVACLFSTFVGMRIPGKYATFLDLVVDFDQPLQRGKKYVLLGQVAFKSSSTATVVINTTICDPDNTHRRSASGKMTARVNEPPVEMPSVQFLRTTATDLGLRDKVVLITGASRGIGETTAKLFSLHGSKVVVNYFRGGDDANRIVEEIKGQRGTALAVQADVSDRRQVKEMIELVCGEYGPIEVLVNNAVRDTRPIHFIELSWDEIEKDLEVIVKGAFNCCQEVIPSMVKNSGGKIINLSTVYAEVPVAGQAKYVISKSALIGLSRTLAVELASNNIQVNMVVPSFVETDLSRHVSKVFVEGMKNDTPLKRNASPVDVARAIVFLASSLASFTTGQKVMVTGGSVPFL